MKAADQPGTLPDFAPAPLDEAARRLHGDLRTWRDAARSFPVRWPAQYLDLAASPAGAPIALMGAPDASELAPHPDELADPVGERSRHEFPFVVRKHADRAILLVTAQCHFYCRFCFRRSFPAGDHRGPTRAEVDAAIAHLAAQRDLREIILSGGDPLTLDDARLREILAACAAIPQVDRLRVHTRAPVHQPARVTPELAGVLVAHGKPVRLVTHADHAVEVGPGFRRAVATLRERGIEVLDQTVLLRGVNDDAATLAALVRALGDAGASPYYLHHPDRVPGASRFFVGIERGLAIHQALAALVPASLLPRYVIDVPDGSGKVPVADLRRVGPRRYRAPSGFEWDDIATDAGHVA